MYATQLATDVKYFCLKERVFPVHYVNIIIVQIIILEKKKKCFKRQVPDA